MSEYRHTCLSQDFSCSGVLMCEPCADSRLRNVTLPAMKAAGLGAEVAERLANYLDAFEKRFREAAESSEELRALSLDGERVYVDGVGWLDGSDRGAPGEEVRAEPSVEDLPPIVFETALRPPTAASGPAEKATTTTTAAPVATVQGFPVTAPNVTHVSGQKAPEWLAPAIREAHEAFVKGASPPGWEGRRSDSGGVEALEAAQEVRDLGGLPTVERVNERLAEDSPAAYAIDVGEETVAYGRDDSAGEGGVTPLTAEDVAAHIRPIDTTSNGAA